MPDSEAARPGNDEVNRVADLASGPVVVCGGSQKRSIMVPRRSGLGLNTTKHASSTQLQIKESCATTC